MRKSVPSPNYVAVPYGNSKKEMEMETVQFLKVENVENDVLRDSSSKSCHKRLVWKRFLLLALFGVALAVTLCCAGHSYRRIFHSSDSSDSSDLRINGDSSSLPTIRGSDLKPVKEQSSSSNNSNSGDAETSESSDTDSSDLKKLSDEGGYDIKLKPEGAEQESSDSSDDSDSSSGSSDDGMKFKPGKMILQFFGSSGSSDSSSSDSSDSDDSDSSDGIAVAEANAIENPGD
jgi:hypothetical protein